jgi:hypothetical protein
MKEEAVAAAVGEKCRDAWGSGDGAEVIVECDN